MKDRTNTFLIGRCFDLARFALDLRYPSASKAGFGSENDDAQVISVQVFVVSYWQYFNHFWHRGRKYYNKQLCKIPGPNFSALNSISTILGAAPD